MAAAQSSPFGSWKSPITSDLIISESIGLGQIALDGGDTYWVEMRPSEGGRHVICQRSPSGEVGDVIPPPFNARSRVHEYGGGAFTVSNGVVFFTNFVDQRLYRKDPGDDLFAITPDREHRHADCIVDDSRARLVCVREDHSSGSDEPINTLVAIDASGRGEPQVLVSGNDFYSFPRLSPDGSTLAWLTWNHPNMPWDGTELWVAEVSAEGSLTAATKVCGGLEESIAQPEWSPQGVLHFVSDRSGWWNLYRWQHGRVEPLFPAEAEFSRPQWVFGAATYGFQSENQIVCSYNERGEWGLGRLDSLTGERIPLETPYTEMGRGDLKVAPGRVLFVAASSTQPMSLISLDLESREAQVLRRSVAVEVEPGYISAPQAIEFPTEGGKTAHAFYYPPRNRDYVLSSEERPPLLVKSHGGPTGAASAGLDLLIQYWTSRGFALVDVNYGGSVGFGREYRKRLEGRWGVVDVDDCVNAARYLVSPGRLQSCSIHAVRSVMVGLQGWNCGFPLSRERRVRVIFYYMGGLCNRPTGVPGLG